MDTLERQVDTAVIVGRWQVFHRGHETLLRAALRAGARVVVVIGSAFRSRDVRNPFTAAEREAMIRATLSPEDSARLHCLPVRDYFDDARWNAAVRAGVEALVGAPQRIALLGFHKDASSYYLDHFPAWAYIPVAREFDIDATALREQFFSQGADGAQLSLGKTADAGQEQIRPGAAAAPDPLQRPVAYPLAASVSAPVQHYLRRWAQGPEFVQCARAQQAVFAQRERWGRTPRLTAHVLLQHADRILLVQRPDAMALGSWALPGELVQGDEAALAAALRALREQAGVILSEDDANAARAGSRVFDHPLRSALGPWSSHTLYLQLGPLWQGATGDSTQAWPVVWVPLAELPLWEDRLFEDHAAMLDAFVGLYP